MNPYRKRGPKNLLVEELKKGKCVFEGQTAQGVGDSATSIFNHGSPESDNTSTCVEAEPIDGQDFCADELASRFESFSLETMKTKYYGAASVFALANSAIAAKEKSLGAPMLRHSRRSLYWESLPWEKETYAEKPRYVFPDNDLIDALLQLYFANIHPVCPILHRPSFERAVADGLHLRSAEFGGTLLAVLAIASRYSNDRRVFVDGNPSLSLSAGWNFASQIVIVRKLFEPTIYEVQMYYILAFYSLSLSEPQIAWLYLGLGIRYLQHRGEHRRKFEGRKWGHQDELWKRAFWSFVVLDRFLSAFLGRPMALHPEEYDVEPPLDVDDEYWDQDQGFSQPPGKPSQLSYFVHNIQIYEIMGDEWEPRTVAELDSAVNKVLDSIPSHLQWNPENPPRGTFFDQAAALHIACNSVRIAIHRQYIQKAAVLAAPSLSICAGAARAIIHTADSWLRKRQRIPPPDFPNPIFVSGVVLVLNMLATKRAGIPLDPKSKDLLLVATAMEILKFAEGRLQPVGRLWELLQEIWSLDGSLPLIYPPNGEQHRSVNGVAPATTPQPAPIQQSTSMPESSMPSASDLPQQGNFYTQLQQQSFEQPTAESNWNGAQAFDQSHLVPGMSMEQLFADTTTPEANHGWIDDELMSMWMAAPTDVAHVNHWDAYLDNRNVDVNWFTDYGAQQQQQQ
ncbi:Zn(2)-C6 fungal-type domain-containing protein [Mycena sanguinolenta]|uniref:Zn(2)-C6 fungal-type domain-containing protein n=1 Tax=Mycena sanguinolenta TaxID=230812 RepID=A0A8H6XSX9_9AGAR|nr:Zn(2)-C6 fungal-type domain-containing protein [Mycena sanguinolenta]